MRMEVYPTLCSLHLYLDEGRTCHDYIVRLVEVVEREGSFEDLPHFAMNLHAEELIAIAVGGLDDVLFLVNGKRASLDNLRRVAY